MKVLQLNVWMGKMEGDLRTFFEKSDYDVICLQEVVKSDNATAHVSRLFFDASKIIEASGMPYSKFFANWSSKIANGTMEMGNLVLSKIPIVSTEQIFVNGKYEEDLVLEAQPLNNTAVGICKLENGLTVVVHHGYWDRNPLGVEKTVEAFSKVGEIVKPLADSEPVVMCGDLNIVHEAPAFRALDFLRDLTFENGVETTLSGRKIPFKVPCDHILVNDKIEVKSFGVISEVVSDHLGIEAEIEIK